jgi:uncharacterized membrane protein
MIVRDQGQSGFATGAGLVAMVVSLLIVVALLLFGLNQFSGTTASSTGGTGGGSASGPSILSRSSAENQIKLCAEGRRSSYGDPPSPLQQAKCDRELAGQMAGSG